VIDFTPELKAEALKIVSQYKIGPLFTPPITRGQDGKIGTLYLPNGANWPGGSYDPETGILYVYSHTLLRILSMVNDPKRSDMNYINGAGGEAGGGAGTLVQGLPLVKPPWGRITAIDLYKGEMAWQVAHGETPDYVRDHPALKRVTIPRTGRTGGAGGSSGGIGTLMTKTLVISGEGGVFTTPSGQKGAMLRAYDKTTGANVAEVYMPGAQAGGPMTYMLNGKQYLVVAVSAAARPAELMAFTLPTEK
jgi:quinoprotein glucose dehydrogenase